MGFALSGEGMSLLLKQALVSFRERDLGPRTHLTHSGCRFGEEGNTFQLWFLSLDTMDIWGQMILSCAVWPGHRRVGVSIPGLCLLDAGSSPPAVMIRNVSRHCHMSPGGKHHSCLRVTALNKNAKCAWAFKPKEPPQKNMICTPNSSITLRQNLMFW